MTLTGPWIPEDDEEDRLLEDIHIATRRANEDGVSKERIASLLAFMASATLTPPDEEKAREQAQKRLEEELNATSDPEPTISCPNCGDPVDNVKTEMGGDIHLRPCGCTVPWEERDKLGELGEDLEP